MDPEIIKVSDGVSVWLDPGGGITIKAVTISGDPVELSPAEARRIAQALLDLSERDEQ